MPFTFTTHIKTTFIMSPKQQSQQLREQLYGFIDQVQQLKSQRGVESVRARRRINWAIAHFENGMDLVEKAILTTPKEKKADQERFEQQQLQQRSYSRTSSLAENQ